MNTDLSIYHIISLIGVIASLVLSYLALKDKRAQHSSADQEKVNDRLAKLETNIAVLSSVVSNEQQEERKLEEKLDKIHDLLLSQGTQSSEDKCK